jgi:hypothetical protein
MKSDGDVPHRELQMCGVDVAGQSTEVHRLPVVRVEIVGSSVESLDKLKGAIVGKSPSATEAPPPTVTTLVAQACSFLNGKLQCRPAARTNATDGVTEIC